uniref:Uncharacterized protein n=1 Tax=Anguilla anguilla TaxID=7936 RepID=A0A0E9REJ3_ANGAN
MQIWRRRFPVPGCSSVGIALQRDSLSSYRPQPEMFVFMM